MLLDKFYNQKRRKSLNFSYIDKSSLSDFLHSFGLGSFSRKLEQQGYENKISSFFFIREKCFNKSLSQLDISQSHHTLFVQLRKELMSIRLDHEAVEATRAGRPFSKSHHPLQYVECPCCNSRPLIKFDRLRKNSSNL